MTENMQANEVREGDFLPGLDNGYVFEVDKNNGYFSYPLEPDVVMPSDTVLIGYHDEAGNECYLLLPGESMLSVKR